MSNGRKFSPEEDRRMVVMRAQGQELPSIARALGRHRTAIEYRLNCLDGVQPKSRFRPTSKRPFMRGCLGGGKAFASAGSHNRLCADCRHRPVSPFEP